MDKCRLEMYIYTIWYKWIFKSKIYKQVMLKAITIYPSWSLGIYMLLAFSVEVYFILNSESFWARFGLKAVNCHFATAMVAANRMKNKNDRGRRGNDDTNKWKPDFFPSSSCCCFTSIIISLIWWHSENVDRNLLSVSDSKWLIGMGWTEDCVGWVCLCSVIWWMSILSMWPKIAGKSYTIYVTIYKAHHGNADKDKRWIIQAIGREKKGWKRERQDRRGWREGKDMREKVYIYG